MRVVRTRGAGVMGDEVVHDLLIKPVPVGNVLHWLWVHIDHRHSEHVLFPSNSDELLTTRMQCCEL